MKIFFLYFIPIFIIAIFAFVKKALHPFKLTGTAQGTTYHITYYADKNIFTETQADSIFQALDSSLSIYKSYSLISKFNKEKRGIILDAHLKKVVAKSLQVSKDSKGLFDITVMPLVNAWGFGPWGEKAPPEATAIDSILSFVGYNKIMIKGDSLVKLNPKTTIDVNGIAQGYSVDVLSAFLDQIKISNYIVEVGGEVKVKGRRQPGDHIMKIGIEAPPENKYDDGIILKTIELKSGAVTTSGKYRKFYESGNKKYSHLIDPKSGYPLQNEIISVTVYAKDAITADAYDNVLIGMTIKDAFCFLNMHPYLQAYFIYTKFGIVTDTASAGFNSLFSK